MNLYSIVFRHYSQKDSEEGIRYFLLAENDEQVYNWFKSADGIYLDWEDNEKCIYDTEKECFIDDYGTEVDGWYDENGNPLDFKTRILGLKGDINDEEYELHDLYYGVTLWGWDLVKENVTSDYSELGDLIKKA